MHYSLRGPHTGDDEEDDDATASDTTACKSTGKLARSFSKGDAENLKLWKHFVTVSLAEFDKTYARLGVKFDTVYGEKVTFTRGSHLSSRNCGKSSIAEDSRGA